MDWSNPIVYELGLTVIAAVGFWIWQMRDLKKAARELKEREEAGLTGRERETTGPDDAR